MGRSSNLELLRIVSMLMVVFSHFFANIPNLNNKYVLDFYGITANFFQIGEIGVVCFVLLSGYFLVDKKFSIIKLIKYALQLWITGVTVLLFTYFVDKSLITSKYLYGSILPFYSLNWFAKAYLLLYLLFPLINFIIHRVTKSQLLKFILIFGFIWTVVPMASLYDYGNVRISVIYIYILGAYLKMYGFSIFDSLKTKLTLVFGSLFVILLSVITIIYLEQYNSCFVGRESEFLSLNSVFVVLCGLGIFLIFRDCHMEYNKFINNVAKVAFGVYLIHDNPLIKPIMWNKIFKTYAFYESDFVVPYAIFCTVVIFIVCGCIDWLRIRYVEKNFDSVINSFELQKFKMCIAKVETCCLIAKFLGVVKNRRIE